MEGLLRKNAFYYFKTYSHQGSHSCAQQSNSEHHYIINSRTTWKEIYYLFRIGNQDFFTHSDNEKPKYRNCLGETLSTIECSIKPSNSEDDHCQPLYYQEKPFPKFNSNQR